MATKKAHKEADENCPTGWPDKLRANWSQLYSVAAEFRRGKSGYSLVPRSEVVAPELIEAKATRKAPAVEATELVRSVWRKCWDHAHANGGQTDYRLVLYKLTGSNIEAFEYVAAGGRIDTSKDSTTVGDPNDGDTVTAGWADLSGQQCAAIAARDASYEKLAGLIPAILEPLAGIIQANADGVTKGAEIQQRGLTMLAQGAEGANQATETREHSRQKIALHKHWISVINRAIDTFGPEVASNFGPQAAQWARDKAKEHAGDVGHAEENFAEENPDDPHIDVELSRVETMSIQDLSDELLDSMNEGQRKLVAGVIGAAKLEDFLTILRNPRNDEREWAHAFMQCSPADAAFPNLLMIFDKTQQDIFVQLYKKAKPHLDQATATG